MTMLLLNRFFKALTYSAIIPLLLLACPIKAETLLTGNIKGEIKDVNGVAVPYVIVAIKNTRYGCSTDANGSYLIKRVVPGTYEITFSGMGYEPMTKTVTVKANETTEINFVASTKDMQLEPIQVKGVKNITGIGHIDEVNNGVIYVGKKTEVVILDSLNANTALDNPREILGRVPGINFSETEGTGFPSNGIGLRGLNPNQNIEMNVRQNGYNLAADVYGYPETYFLPPMEAVDRVEVTRGAASLQFGAQFGGAINYIIKSPPKDKAFEFTTQQTVGSNYLFNSFNSIGGTYKKISYFGYIQLRSTDGWRTNTAYKQLSGYANIKWQVNNKVSLQLEYSILRNKNKMPGGLTDSLYAADAQQSNRPRNWITTPWNVWALTLNYQITPRTELNIKTSVLKGARELIWLNEDVPVSVADTIILSLGTYAPRELEKESFLNSTTEIRLLSHYNLGRTSNTVAAGIRFYYGFMRRLEGGEGSVGTGFDHELAEGDYANKYDFTTINFAPFIENTFRVTEQLSITPGIRLEYLRSSAKGVHAEDDTIYTDEHKTRIFPLAGIGLQYRTTRFTNIYANISQSYRPIEYSLLTPFGSVSKIDPNLKDASGFNADLGWRGSVKNYLNFDVGGFFLWYHNRPGVLLKTDSAGTPYTYRTNIADSRHMGVETYVELNLTKLITQSSKGGYVSIFNSFAYINATYRTGEFAGNKVEYAPNVINRTGLTYSIKNFSTTIEFSYTGSQYGDASNAVSSNNPVAGIIPAYKVFDWSASYHFLKHFNIKAGINNLADARYFTKRADEYPGPGIIPSEGRTFYISAGAKF